MFTLLISSFVLFLPLIIELPFPLVVFCVFFVVCCLFPPIGCRHFIFFPHWNLMAPQVSKGCGRLWLAIGRLSHTCTSGETWGRKSFPRSFGWKYLKCFVYIFEEQLDGGFNPLWKIFVKWEHFPRNVWNHHPDKHDSHFTVVFSGQTLERLLILRLGHEESLFPGVHLVHQMVPLEKTGPKR